jgi:hypothetical protein
MKRMLCAAALLIALSVVAFLVANWWVGGGSSATVEEVARSKCIKDGFPAQNMVLRESWGDTNNPFGFGGRATVVFAENGKLLRVELRRTMNLMEWEAVSVVEEKDQ